MKTNEELAKAEEEYVLAKKVEEEFENEVSELTNKIGDKIKQEIKDKPFLMVVKTLVKLAALFIVALKPSSMNWIILIRTAFSEFKTNLHDEIAFVESASEDTDKYEGVPMEITKDGYIQHFDNA